MVIKEQIFISCFNLMRTIHLYLPEDYYSTNKHYPVFYMYDGHNLFYDEDATYGKSWGLQDYLTYTNTDLIVVGIECNHEGTQRIQEFSPYSFKNKELGTIHGKGKILMKWVIDELKPYIDQNYRTLSDREHTGIGGSSMGGLMSLYTIAHHNDVFSMAACISSHIFPVKRFIKKELLNCTLFDHTRIYISWGSDEFKTKNQLANISNTLCEYTRIFHDKGANVYPNLVVHGTHSESSWEYEVPIFIPYLLNKRT